MLSRLPTTCFFQMLAKRENAAENG